MPSIRIVKVPPGFAPPSIREQWIGVEIPLPTEDEIRENPSSRFGLGSANEDGYRVFRFKAVEALRQAGKQRAATYWSETLFGIYLVFKKDVCELVP